MFRLVTFQGDTIRLDEKAVTESLNSLCRRQMLYVEGLAALDDQVTFICSDAPEGREDPCYSLTPVSGWGTLADLEADLRSRYDNGFRNVGAFKLADGYWLLSERYQ